jgi:ferrochelatase
MTTTPTGVLLLAYGTPETPDQVEPYFRHIRGGRSPSPDAVEHLKHRYELVGGRTPLLAITTDTARELEAALDRRAPGEYRTYIAMKHWHPFIADVIPRIAADGIRRVIAIVLAPHYSRMSVGGYRKYLDDAVEGIRATTTEPIEVTFVESWHLHPAFTDMMVDRVRDGLGAFAADTRSDVRVVFSAHSLPERIRTWNDPYEAQLRASCAAVAERLGLADWRFAWQSAGNTGEPWLGPDILEYLEALHDEGVRAVLSVPIGFVCDHLEVLFDIDREAVAKAAALGMTLRRTTMPNASPAMIAVLEALVTDARSASPAPAHTEVV